MAIQDQLKEAILTSAKNVLDNKTTPLSDFESFVVTNPDIVDPGIDVSGLRTTTDANILGNITDFPGIQYEAYNPSRLSDLMRLYSSGLPTTDTAQIPGAIDTLVDVGGGGGMDQVTGDSVAGFDPGVTPGPSGFIGLDPDMDIDPQDFAQEDYGIYDPPELGGVDGMSGGQATPGAEFADQNPYGGTGSMDDLGADSFQEYQEPTVSQQDVIGTDANVGYVDAPATEPTVQDVIGTDANVGFVDAPATELGSQINSAFENVKDQGVGAIESFKDTLVGLGGKVKEGFNNVIEFGDTQIDVGKTLATGVINYIGRSIFGPVGSFLGTALGAIKSDPIDAAIKSGLSEKGYGFDDIGRLTTGPMAGYSVESGFGDGIADATLDRIDKIENRTAPQTTASIEKVQKLYDFLGDVTTVKAAATAPQEDIGAIPGDINTGVAPDGTLPDGTNIMDEFAPSDIQATDPTLDISDRGRGDVDQDTTDTDPADDFDDGTMTGGVAPSTNKTGIDSFFDAVDSTAGGDGADTDVGGTGSAAAADTSQGETGYGSCFIAGTKVTMSDGTLKNIEEIVVGDKVKGHKEENTVIKLDPTLLGDRKLYSFNNKHYFFTSEHPFMTEEGWKSIKPEKTKKRDGVELYEQLKGELKVGDKLITDNSAIEITSINSKEINKPDMPLYNFNVSNDNSYIANGYVVHNKGGGGGKIVCTMMNDSYGFGSFRNKIWLRHSKDLAPEYQKGYHKIFLPLVKLSKTNKILKKTLEHIAVHRTIDIRQESRGKVHLLGRVYRKILEPICYLVGKYVK